MHGHGGRRGHKRLAAEEPDEERQRRLSLSQLAVLLRPYFWPEAARDRLRALSCFVLLGASKACNLLAPLYIGVAVDAMALAAPFDAPLGAIAAFAALRFLSKAFKELQNFVYLDVKQTAYREVAARTFRHLHQLSLNWHLSKKTGRALRSMDRGIRSANTVVTYLFLSLGPTVVEWIVTCVIFLTKFGAPLVALVGFVSFIVYVILTFSLTKWRKKIRARMNEQDNDAQDKAVDSLTNFETVKYFTAEEWELRRYTDSIKAYGKHVVHTYASLHLLNTSQQFVIWVSTLIVLILVGNSVAAGEASVGDFIALQVYMVQLFSPLSFLGSIYGAVVDAFEDMRHLSELLARQPDIQDAPDARDLPTTPGKGLDVEFRDVSFHYPSQNPDMGLKGISFKVPAGKTVGLVGSTGAGKSTISRLLFRFYDVKSGEVLVGGVPVTEYKQRALRRAIGIVPQDTVLFNDTIHYNVKYGRVDAEDMEIDEAVQAAQISDFISRLEKGYDTMVGERGLKLSGGEKQRVAIARTLLKNPPVLVLDEATSALDSLTEQEIQSALRRLSAGRTVLVIAHRLSTIRDADEIIVMDHGCILERGSHDTLVALGGEYSKMWERQMQERGEEAAGGAGDDAAALSSAAVVDPAARGGGSAEHKAAARGEATSPQRISVRIEPAK